MHTLKDMEGPEVFPLSKLQGDELSDPGDLSNDYIGR